VSSTADADGGATAPTADDAVLTEPARAQVIALAAEVVGRLPADEVPAPLRAIARFTPAKRQRLGGAALAAALDTDEGFREAVGATVAESSPGLTAAVRAGGPTAAADPVDVAIVAYLIRPDGWPDLLAAANRRIAAERDAGGGSRQELESLRAELAELRSRARGEAARTREAVASAVGQAERELDEARRTLRERIRELRTAERERAAALDTAAEAAARLGVQASAHDAELRRLRGRLVEVERAAEGARRGARSERDVDDARLWLLVDTLVQAATGVRRELSLAPPELRPADAVGSGSAAEGTGRVAGDPAALDRLLALPNVHVVVDGYNVTKTGYPELSLADQRIRLIGALAPLAAQSGAEVTIAFDGGPRPPAQPPTPRGVRVLFSAADEIADDLIRRLVAAEPGGRPVIVVTSDRQVVLDTGRDGAWSVPSSVLLARLG
jgi:predicted RNA-binding protein with PIN domain